MESSPESLIASARALAAKGARWEAECLLWGALRRLPKEGRFRSALMGLSIDATSQSWPPVALPHVEAWMGDGLLVEALSALSGTDLGTEGIRWARFLGELLAPPPAPADEGLTSVHQALLRGGASVAMTTLEDMGRAAPLSPWASRRLQLLQWMLLDNAPSAPRDSQIDGLASDLAKALFAPLEARNLVGMAEAAKTVDHPDAELTARALERLAGEVQKQGSPDTTDMRTVAHMGRASAAMQLHMTAFENARAVYETMLQKAAQPEIAQLLIAVQGVERVLNGRPFNHRSFAVPKSRTFDDETRRHPEQRALASAPAAIGGTKEGLGFDDETRVARSAEIPLAAFGNDDTRSVVLPEAKVVQGKAPSFGDEVTAVDARHAASVSEVEFDDITVRKGVMKVSPPEGAAPSPAFPMTKKAAAAPAGAESLATASTDFATDDTQTAQPAQPKTTKFTRAEVAKATAAQEPREQTKSSAAAKGAGRDSVIVAAIVSVGKPES